MADTHTLSRAEGDIEQIVVVTKPGIIDARVGVPDVHFIIVDEAPNLVERLAVLRDKLRMQPETPDRPVVLKRVACADQQVELCALNVDL